MQRIGWEWWTGSYNIRLYNNLILKVINKVKGGDEWETKARGKGAAARGWFHERGGCIIIIFVHSVIECWWFPACEWRWACPHQAGDIVDARHCKQELLVVTWHGDRVQIKICRWVPKVELPKPIPLTFVNEELDYMIDFVVKSKRSGAQRRLAED